VAAEALTQIRGARPAYPSIWLQRAAIPVDHRTMRQGDRVLLQYTGAAGVPMPLHLRWATVVDVAGLRLVVQPDDEPNQLTIGLDQVRTWTKAADPES
jgi:hypothetical protein